MSPSSDPAFEVTLKVPVRAVCRINRRSPNSGNWVFHLFEIVQFPKSSRKWNEFDIAGKTAKALKIKIKGDVKFEPQVG